MITKPRKRKRRDPRPLKEDPIHKFAIQLLQFNAVPNLIYYHAPNGARMSERTVGYMKSLGMLPGVADLSIVLPGGRACFLEFKREHGGETSAAQDAFRDLCRRNGTPYEIANTPDEVTRILTAWGAIGRPAQPIAMARAA